MTPAQAAYRAGCIVSEVEARYAGKRRLSPACLGNCSRLPAKIPVFLRHLRIIGGHEGVKQIRAAIAKARGRRPPRGSAGGGVGI